MVANKHKIQFKDFEIIPGTLKDVWSLSKYHYQPKITAPICYIRKIVGRGRNRSIFPDPIAIDVHKMPIERLRLRNIATNNYFLGDVSRSERAKLVCKNIRYACRIIVDPRFRQLGLAKWLIACDLDEQTVPIVETLTPIDYTNHMLTDLGFKIYYQPTPERYLRIYNAIAELGLHLHHSLLPTTLKQRIDCLDNPLHDKIIYELNRMLSQLRHKKTFTGHIDQYKYILGKFPYPQAYLIWFNPKKNFPPK